MVLEPHDQWGGGGGPHLAGGDLLKRGPFLNPQSGKRLKFSKFEI